MRLPAERGSTIRSKLMRCSQQISRLRTVHKLRPPRPAHRKLSPRRLCRLPRLPLHRRRLLKPPTPNPAPPTGAALELRPGPVTATIPAGEHVTVRMIDSIDSDKNQAGQVFRASLVSPLVSHGRVVVPAGTTVTVLLANANRRRPSEGTQFARNTAAQVGVQRPKLSARQQLI